MRERFEQIYETNEWGFGSGEGSLPVHTRGYVRFLQRFLRRRGIQRVVDLGCGDWQFSRYVDWEGIRYDDYDLVQSLIQANRKNYSRPNIHFHCLDLRRPPFNLAAREVFSFTNYRPGWRRFFEKPRWRKKVLLLDMGTDWQ